ncbi:aminotransferase, class IV superfamily [Verrucomicrobiia bacterium DG1235]|nr:aminotransferase, class IV superfamily [Verrucomicrobiae bacterium DG1235]
MNRLFLDGELLERVSVSMPLLSRGFAYGYGVFETMKFIDGEPCFFAEHLERLRRAAAGAGLKVDLDEAIMREQAYRLFEAEGCRSGVFKIVISDTGENRQLAMFVRSAGLSEMAMPLRLMASKVVKASRAFTSRHKTLNYMESVLELEAAKAAGGDECVFRNEHGQLTECAIANLFFVKGGVLKTPELECGLLDGIVRSKVIGLARAGGTQVEEGRFTEADLLAADEVFVTSSGNGPRSVGSYRALDGSEVTYRSALLPALRDGFLKLESEDVRLNAV